MSSANGFDLPSDSSMGLITVRGFCFCKRGEFEMLSVDVSITTVSSEVDVVELDNVPIPPGSVLTRL